MQNNINLQSISAVLHDEVEFFVKTLMPLNTYTPLLLPSLFLDRPLLCKNNYLDAFFEDVFSVKTLMPLNTYSTAAVQFIFGSAIALQK